MRIPLRFALIATVALAAACGRGSAPDDALASDIQAAGSSVELAPAPAGTQVMSAIEQTPRATPARSATTARAPRRTQAAPARAPRAVTPAPVPEVEAPAPQPQHTDPAPAPVTRRPQAPAVNPPPPGGYKTPGEIIRNAPFPINP